MPQKAKKINKTRKKTTNKKTKNILWFKEISIKDVELVGGKNASLGEMYSQLTKKGIKVPNGFAVTANAYWEFLNSADLKKKMKKALQGLNVNDVKELARVGKQVRDMILHAPLPKSLEKQIITAYKKLSAELKQKNAAVAVRSSATAEDLPDASFAGQQETFLNVKGEQEVLRDVKRCIASLFNARAISYREGMGFDHMDVALSVTIQQMVNADTGSSGVMFTLDTESGFKGVTLVTSTYGLGEYVVQGRVVPDQFYVFEEGLNKGKKAVISKILGSKEVKLVYGPKGTKQEKVAKSARDQFSISEDDVVQLAKWGAIIEQHYNKPQDIEWAKDGKTGKLYIVQARPETVKARKDGVVIEKYHLKKEGKILLTGIAIGQKIGVGRVRVIENPKDMKMFKKGDVLVTRITDPDWEPIMRIAGAIVTEQGGKTSHAAIVSRELGVPCIVGASSARKILKKGQKVTVSCAKGDEGIIYRDILPFEVKRTELKEIPNTKTKIMMIVGDPDHAFDLSFLPQDGVGLAREEFIFSNFIRIHPLALLHYNKLKDKRAKKKIREMTRGYKKKQDYCVDKLAEGIGRIAAAMYPNDVVLRLSDFKSNEYATLIGGKEFEPKEENPMIGWRGASRYYSKEYKQAFGLECKAIKKVREDWGLDNVITMVPFCRTPEEGKKVLKTMADFGLKQGDNGLKVYVMCELPSNVVLAEDFIQIFDGFSIGSNDLTQLTLGVDRDSALVSHVFDENNKGIKQMVRDVIRIAHKYKKPVGICGQAPSDHPEFAEFLVRERIDSISLNPDTVVETRRRIAKAEKTIGKTGKKTNKKVLSLVGALAIAGASLISLGAGCSSMTINNNSYQDDSNLDVSPAEIRQRAEERLLKQQEEENKKAMTHLQETNFAEFSLMYPRDWGVEHWDGGLTLEDPESDDYISIFRQVLGHPIEEEKREKTTVGGRDAEHFGDQLPKDGTPVMVVEVSLDDGGILEINSNSDRFSEVLESIEFLDTMEGKLCIQVITYAKETFDGACQPFPTPCDVPEDWLRCDQ